MEPGRAEVLDWLQGRMSRPLTPAEQADLLHAPCRIGDDTDNLIAEFAARFGVDLSPLRPDMHWHGKDRFMWLHWPIPSPPPHGAWVPLSVTILHQAAVERRWPVIYPDLPKVRDLSWLNPILVTPGLVATTMVTLWLVEHLL